MESNGKQTNTLLDCLLADEIYAITQYMVHSKTRDNSDHAELHNAILAMHNDFPRWVQQRAAFLEQTSVNRAIREDPAPLASPGEDRECL